MTFTFHKGKHRARPLYWLNWWPLYVNPSRVAKMVQFSFSSKYDLGGYDQHNKLFGLAFGGVHKHSARFGWRYDNKRSVFILSAYCYVDGKREIRDLCECVANHNYSCEIFNFHDHYWFRVCNEKGDLLSDYGVHKGHHRKIAFLLGPFFGGAFSAPVTLELQMKKPKP
jgi:hypothetical protein